MKTTVELKRIHHDAVPKALELAERYRLLNEPEQAESIARDVLEIEPKNQQAVVTLVLALTDQFTTHHSNSLHEAEKFLTLLTSPYQRSYYHGVALERWARAKRSEGLPSHAVDDWIERAMACFEKAEPLRPAGNDDSILRWNTCARMLHRSTEHREDEPLFGD
ncbi:MAG: hypothetical protein ACHQ50_02575 [Fimbriimonadales bacterium]